MPLFKRKKPHPENRPSAVLCPQCGSGRVKAVTLPGSENDFEINVWRGQRLVNCHCAACGKDFYVEEKKAADAGLLTPDDNQIDEDALRDAEEEIKQQYKDNPEGRIFR